MLGGPELSTTFGSILHRLEKVGDGSGIRNIHVGYYLVAAKVSQQSSLYAA